MAARDSPAVSGTGERGQATLLVLGLVAALLTGLLVLLALGQAVGAHGRRQSAADLAAMSAVAAMRGGYPRLFEPAFLEPGVPNPRHLSTAAYLALTRAAARRVAARNGAAPGRVAVSFPPGFAPTRVTVTVRGFATARVPGRREPTRVAVSARAVAELAPASDATLEGPARASGGGYDGPLAYRMGKAMRPDVAAAFDRMAGAAGRAGIYLSITSAFRSDAEQARLFAANPNPKWVAPPGTSLHRYATELDLGPPGAYAWLAVNARRFGFIHRYAWEAWHYECALGLYRRRGLRDGLGGRFSLLQPRVVLLLAGSRGSILAVVAFGWVPKDQSDGRPRESGLSAESSTHSGRRPQRPAAVGAPRLCEIAGQQMWRAVIPFAVQNSRVFPRVGPYCQRFLLRRGCWPCHGESRAVSVGAVFDAGRSRRSPVGVFAGGGPRCRLSCYVRGFSCRRETSVSG